MKRWPFCGYCFDHPDAKVEQITTQDHVTCTKCPWGVHFTCGIGNNQIASDFPCPECGVRSMLRGECIMEVLTFTDTDGHTVVIDVTEPLVRLRVYHDFLKEMLDKGLVSQSWLTDAKSTLASMEALCWRPIIEDDVAKATKEIDELVDQVVECSVDADLPHSRDGFAPIKACRGWQLGNIT